MSPIYRFLREKRFFLESRGNWTIKPNTKSDLEAKF